MNRLLLAMILVVAAAQNIMAEVSTRVEGTYRYGGRDRGIVYYMDEDKTMSLIILESPWSNAGDVFVFDAELLDDINQSLTELKHKFLEWSKVAEENDVLNYSKEVDIAFPEFGYIHNMGSRVIKGYHVTPKIEFIVKNTLPELVMRFELYDSHPDKYINIGKVNVNMLFMFASDFNTLINALNPVKAEQAFKETKGRISNEELDDLFQ